MKDQIEEVKEEPTDDENKYTNFRNSLKVIKEFVESGYCDRLIIECNLYDNTDDSINRFIKNNLKEHGYKDLDVLSSLIMSNIEDGKVVR